MESKLPNDPQLFLENIIYNICSSDRMAKLDFMPINQSSFVENNKLTSTTKIGSQMDHFPYNIRSVQSIMSP